MVYYFTSNVVSPPGFIYVGKDKFENEDLIKHGWEEDIWFHADKLSSAHIYLRLPTAGDSDDGSSSASPPWTWETLPEALLTDLAQLTKANSIEGNKKDNVAVVYTPWSNLRKDGSMEVGQVSFKDPRRVRRVLVPQRENPIVNRLNKTKVERKPDLKQEKDDHLRKIRQKDQAAQLARRKEEQKQALEWKQKKYEKDHAYDDLFTEDLLEGSSNQNRSEDWEDDFM